MSSDNRGLPTQYSSDRIDGIHKDKNLSYQTLKDMETINADYVKFAKKFSITLNDVNKVMNKSIDNLMKSNKETENSIKEYENNIVEMKKKYRGINKHIADEYEKYANIQIAELKKKNEELKDTTRKNIIKESFKKEKEQYSVELWDNKYIKNNYKDIIGNEYESELEKLKSSALDMFGEDFKENSQYQTALLKLGKEYTEKALKESFKQDTEKNQIKYLDNQYSKGNNLAKTSNEYYNQLEKLKSDSVDVYGENFENNAEYKKALMNLNDKYAKEMNDAWKEDFKENHKALSEVSDGIKNTFEKNKETLQGLLGPLNLFIEPLKDFFGGFGLVFKFIGGGIKRLFGKFTKKNPTASDVLKTGAFGVGSLYIINEIKKIFDFDKDNKIDNKKNGILGKIPIIGKLIPSLTSLFKSIPILGNFLKGFKLLGKSFGKNALGKGGNIAKFFKSGATKTAFKSMGPMMIVVALIEMAIDGIKGFFKSKKWGVSKIGGALGSFLGGASEGGLKNAFSSMGKWALLGAGIGSVVAPVIGTIAGGLIGGAIGAILGAIGGKNLAKGIDKLGAKIGAWFKDVWWASIKEPFIELKDKIKDIWSSDKSLGKKIGKIVGELIMYPINSTIMFFSKNKEFFSKIFKSKDLKKSIVGLGTSIINGFKNFNFKDALSKLKNKLGDIFTNVFNFSNDVIEGIKESSLGQFITDLFDKIKNKLGEWMNMIKESPMGQFVKNVFDKIKDKLGEWLGAIKESPMGQFVQSVFEKMGEGITKFFDENPVGKWMNSYIVLPIKNAFKSMGVWFSYIGDAFDEGGIVGGVKALTTGLIKDKKTGLSQFDIYKESYMAESIEDAIIRPDGSVIKTNPKDTLIALKDIPLSMEQVRNDTTKNLNNSLNGIENDKNLEKKLTTIIDVLSKILAKDIQVNIPPQTRSDLDVIMNGGMI